MSDSNLTFVELQNLVYSELKVPQGATLTTQPPGTEAYPLSMIQELLNEAYYDVYNQPGKNIYLRENAVEFDSLADSYLTAAVVVGDTTINVSTTTGWPTAGVLLLNTDFITYTGTTLTTFTGCTGVNNKSLGANDTVRACYSLAIKASDMDQQQIREVMSAGLDLEFQPPERFLQTLDPVTLWYTIFMGYLILPIGTVSQNIFIQYYKLITLMSGATDTPALIPNNFRKGLLVMYAVGRALILDDKRTGWDEYFNYNAALPGKSSGHYFRNLRMFLAKFTRRVDAEKKQVSTIYD